MHTLTHFGTTLVDILDYHAAQSPDAAAFTFYANGESEGDILSYGRLRERAVAVAAGLQRQASPGDRVILAYPAGLDYIVGFLACLYAGMVAVPSLPPSGTRTLPRLKAILADAQPALVLAPPSRAREDGSLAQVAADLRWQAVDAMDGDGAGYVRPAIAPDDLAFLQYTSGSTGSPKGVMVSHGNIVANVGSLIDTFQVPARSCIVSWLPPHHDMGLIGMILANIQGGHHAVLFPPAAFLMRPYRWLKLISDHKAAVSAGPNFAFDLCVRKITAEDKAGLDLSSLKVLGSGAEPIRASSLQRFAACFADCGLDAGAITPMYGLAEATLFVTASLRKDAQRMPVMLKVGRDALADSRIDAGCADTAVDIVSVGCTARGHAVTIVHPETGLALPDDVIGEICFSGPSVTRGYWRKPEASAKLFAGAADGRRVRTGDLGFLHDGDLFITGRLKDVMIFGGRNVYPQDIEEAAESLDDAFVANGCAAFALEEEGMGQLVLVQEIAARGKPDGTAIVPRVRGMILELYGLTNLADLVFVRPGTIPRTSSGKIQRSLTAQLYQSGALQYSWRWKDRADAGAVPAAGERRPPSTPTELTLATFWAELIPGAEPVQDSDFFAEGGHSLLATQLASRIQGAFGFEFPLFHLFENPTLGALARTIDAMLGDAQPARSMPLTASPRGEQVALSFAQQRLWFLDRLEPGSAAYNIPAALRLHGSLDVEVLDRTLDEIVRRHEVLRTSFTVGGTPLQVIAPATRAPLTLVDLSGLADQAEREARVQALARTAAEASFDLARGPLLRVVLLRLAHDQHVMLLTTHHIVSDGWSMGVMVREIAALYGAFAQGLPSPLAPLPVQYADFSLWQRDWLQGPVLERQLAYWRDRLVGAPGLLTLPTDRPRPAVRSQRGAALAFEIPAATVDALHARGRAHGATLFMTLYAAFGLLMARYSGQQDICIGTPIANRNRAEVEELIGFFANTLVLRADFDPGATVAQLLEQLRSVCLGAYAHQDVPFEQLVDMLKPERHLSHTPLFQVMLVLQNTPMGSLELPGLRLETLEAERSVAKFDLVLTLTERGGALHADFEYSTDLYDRATIERMAGHFERLLRALVEQPEARIGELPLLSPQERDRQLMQWNRTEVAYPADQCIHSLFEAQAAATPDAIAVVFEQQQLTYRELDAQANRLAHFLVSRGVEPDGLVGICVERSLEMMVGLLGILKAGGAYVPLDPSYPAERLAHMLEDSRPVALLGHGATRTLLRRLAPGVPVVDLDADRDSWSCMPAHGPGEGVTGLQSSHLAYVIYTSGSTGKPKGAMNEHRAVVNRLRWMQDAYGLAPHDCVLQKTPLSFDVSVWELFWPLTSGARLCLARPMGHRDPGYLAALIREQAITTAHFVPSMLQVFLEQADAASCAPLVRVVCSGEALPASLAQRFHALLPQVELHNLYGPTEAAVDVTAWQCVPGDTRTSVPIGRPIANTRTYILDRSMQPVPVGVTGELYLGGVQIGRGYLNRPELTAERFVLDPFSGDPAARLYKTGDLCRYLPDGTIEYIGRNDFQVKIRGLRIELGEIETALAGVDGVRECVLLVREDCPGDRRLVAYVVADDGAAAPHALRAALLERLPEYMVPSAFVALDALPLTANGKVDRAALPAPDKTRDHRQPFAAPSTPTEQVLAGMWAELLRLEQVGVEDNFFESGGNSLLLVELHQRLIREVDKELTLVQLFQNPTVASLTRHLDRAVAVEPVASTDGERLRAGRQRLSDRKARLRTNRL